MEGGFHHLRATFPRLPFAITRPRPMAAIAPWMALAAMLRPALFATVADVVEERIRATAMSLFNAIHRRDRGGPLLCGVFSHRLAGGDLWVLHSSSLWCRRGLFISPPGTMTATAAAARRCGRLGGRVVRGNRC